MLALCSRFKADITECKDFKQAAVALSSISGVRTLLQSLKMAVLEVGTQQDTLSETNLVKHLGMELQRSQPMEWNEFMTACLVEE